MRKFTILITILTMTVRFCIGQTEFSASGYDALRIENEVKLTVPNKLVDSVWTYLNWRYGNDSLYLKEIDSTFNCKIAIDSFIDQYYDNEKLSLLNIHPSGNIDFHEQCFPVRANGSAQVLWVSLGVLTRSGCGVLQPFSVLLVIENNAVPPVYSPNSSKVFPPEKNPSTPLCLSYSPVLLYR